MIFFYSFGKVALYFQKSFLPQQFKQQAANKGERTFSIGYSNAQKVLTTEGNIWVYFKTNNHKILTINKLQYI